MNKCCCTNTLNLCEQDVCGDVDFGFKASAPGVYALITHFLGMRIKVEKEFSMDEELIFPLDNFNEDYEYTAEIIDPLGDKATFISGDITYDCFKFKTTITKNVGIGSLS